MLLYARDEDEDPVLFLADPDSTCNNGFINLFSSSTKYKPESTNSGIKGWVIISNFIPAYLKHEYFISSFRYQVEFGSGSVEKNVGSLSPDFDGSPL